MQPRAYSALECILTRLESWAGAGKVNFVDDFLINE
ncbi:hypothetical protein SAMN05421858_3528 [Haladaptatus litoreus]|uniref:Uncharacterized protein n=1 Tax=Haladaptatus litoreus TaxID=553468 RepID=A0A1N7DD74_9EURY|nr:hypothetical protein SAMN05421858_3528 [Haladaptatus litoreus]